MESTENIENTTAWEATTPLSIAVTSPAHEVLAWRSLARQTVPLLQHPELFPTSQRTQLAQTIVLLLDGDLELEDVFGEDKGYEPGCGDGETDGHGTGRQNTGEQDAPHGAHQHSAEEPWQCA